MKKIFLSILALSLCISALSCAPSNVSNESQLIGEWKMGAGSTAESISLMKTKAGTNKYTYYKQGRLIESGSWRIKENKLMISLKNGKERTYDEFRIENGALVLKDPQGMSGKYEAAGGQIKEEEMAKTEEKPSQPEPSDFRINSLKELLMTIRSNTGIEFGEPRRATFTWSISDGGEISVHGFEIIAQIPVNGDFSGLNARANDVARYLYSTGFDSDAANTTEITTGAKKNGLVCVVALPWTNNSDPEGAFPLTVRCGYIR